MIPILERKMKWATVRNQSCVRKLADEFIKLIYTANSLK